MLRVNTHDEGQTPVDAIWSPFLLILCNMAISWILQLKKDSNLIISRGLINFKRLLNQIKKRKDGIKNLFEIRQNICLVRRSRTADLEISNQLYHYSLPLYQLSYHEYGNIHTDG